MNENAIDRKLVCAFIAGLISDDGERKKGLEYIRSMSPVNPTKTGHWIDSPNGYFTYCSECGLHGDKGIYKHYGWCPKCGCRMVEPQERSDKE